MLRQGVILLFLAGVALCQLPVEDRVDCHPDPDANEANCLSRGCLFDQSSQPGVPWCYYPPEFGYFLNSMQNTENGFTAELIKSGPPTFVPDEFVIIRIDAEFQTNERLRIKIHPDVPRYEVMSFSASVKRKSITFGSLP